MTKEPMQIPSGVVSMDEVEKFYNLLPKIQELELYVESQQQQQYLSQIKEKGLRPYSMDIDIRCSAIEHASESTQSPTTVFKDQTNFVIEFIISDYKLFIDTFLNNVKELLTKTCKDLEIIQSNDSEESEK